jgi:hypothetical protein
MANKKRVTKYKVWVEIERIDNFGTDDEEYSDCDFPVGIAYCDTYEDAEKLQQEIEKAFGEL